LAHHLHTNVFFIIKILIIFYNHDCKPIISLIILEEMLFLFFEINSPAPFLQATKHLKIFIHILLMLMIYLNNLLPFNLELNILRTSFHTATCFALPFHPGTFLRKAQNKCQCEKMCAKKW